MREIRQVEKGLHATQLIRAKFEPDVPAQISFSERSRHFTALAFAIDNFV
jgi:hypothetical protein